jgi:hypothetical protein
MNLIIIIIFLQSAITVIRFFHNSAFIVTLIILTNRHNLNPTEPKAVQNITSPESYRTESSTKHNIT